MKLHGIQTLELSKTLSRGLHQNSFTVLFLYCFQNQEQHAGQIGLTLVVAGVAGSIIAGVWLDRTKLFK